MQNVDAVITAARSWIGTPFRHQCRVRGRQGGVDCWNLVRGVGEEIGSMQITEQAFKRFEGYSRIPGDGLLKSALREFLNVEIEPRPPAPGDVLLIARRMTEDPKHCGIVGFHKDRLTLIHAAANYGGCVEHTLTGFWLRHTVGIYNFR